MGIGTPEYILTAVEAGIDIFDCVYPTRISRNALAMTRDGNLNLRLEANRLDQRPIDSECGCHTCRSYSRSYNQTKERRWAAGTSAFSCFCRARDSLAKAAVFS